MRRDKIHKYEFKDQLKKKSKELFGRKIPLSKRQKFEEEMEKEFFGPLPFIRRGDLESRIVELQRNVYKESNPEKKGITRNKIDFLKRLTYLD